MTKNIIFAAALLAFCSPAFAGERGHGGAIVGGTSATSLSGVATMGSGYSSTFAHGGNESWGSASVTSGGQRAATGSYSSGGGWSDGKSVFETYGSGTSGAGTMGVFGGH